jgi:hypothetical protein
MVRVVEIVVILLLLLIYFLGIVVFWGVSFFFVTETSAKSGIEPDPAYSIHTWQHRNVHATMFSWSTGIRASKTEFLD